jgi:2-dehydropantoate 2-reductase
MSKGVRWLVGGVLAAGVTACLALERRRREEMRRLRNHGVRVLVVGAGVVGSSYAAQMARWGMQVSLVARGSRLDQLRRDGLRVQNAITGRVSQTHVELLAETPASGEYDLALVAVRYGQAEDAFQGLRALSPRPPILLMQNNPTGPETLLDSRLCGNDETGALAQSLGNRRVLLGFPASGGHRRPDGVVRCLPVHLAPMRVGESDGADTQALHQALAVLRRARIGMRVERKMTDWLSTHAAAIAVLAGVTLKNGGHVRRAARRPSEARLYLAALREAYTVLEASGSQVTPRSKWDLLEQPAWLALCQVMALSAMPFASLAVDGHLAAAPQEMRSLYDHLVSLARAVDATTPTLDSLERYFSAAARSS